MKKVHKLHVGAILLGIVIIAISFLFEQPDVRIVLVITGGSVCGSGLTSILVWQFIK